MYNDVSLLECLNKSFILLNSGKNHGRTSSHKPKRKAEGYKKVLPALPHCYKNSSLFIHKVPPWTPSYPQKRKIRSHRTVPMCIVLFLMNVISQFCNSHSNRDNKTTFFFKKNLFPTKNCWKPFSAVSSLK